MIKLYFKQSWEVIKQNRLFSGVYMLGTALSIALVMAYAIVWHIRIADIYPEGNRSRSLYMSFLAEVNKEGTSSSSMSKQFIETVLPEELWGEEIEAVAISNAWKWTEKLYSPVLPEGMTASVLYASPEICRVFDYRFVYGGPFTKEDMTARAKKVFITVKCARELFGEENAVGKQFRYRMKEYTVCGVIENISPFAVRSYADIWLPLSEHPEYEKSGFGVTGMLGEFTATILARSSRDFDKIRADVSSRIKKLNGSSQQVQLKNYGQPDTHFASIFRRSSNQPIKFSEPVTKIALILLALLLVPAINLAGIIASGMDGRLEEMGIRKAFGASRSVLVKQILYENFLLTLLGGALGLLFSYLIVYFASSTLCTVIGWNVSDLAGNVEYLSITPQMLFSPAVFVMAFGMCLLLNILSAIVPACIALRKNIVYSLTANKK